MKIYSTKLLKILNFLMDSSQFKAERHFGVQEEENFAFLKRRHPDSNWG